MSIGQPESRFVVATTDTGVSCTGPNGNIESVDWDDVQTVLIETNNTGPFGTDLWWMLVGKQGGCVVPMGATGTVYGRTPDEITWF